MDTSGQLPPIQGQQQQTGYSQGGEQPMMYEGDNKKSIRAAGVSIFCLNLVTRLSSDCPERRLLILCELFILTELQLY